MPAAIRYIPPTDTQRHPLLAVAQQDRERRKKAYRTALSYYENEYDKQLLIDPEGEEPDYNVGINLVKMTADRTASFLFPTLPTFEIDTETPEQTEEERWVEDFFTANGGLQTFNKMALRGFLAGHVFCRVRPSPRIYQGKVYPSFVVLDPITVSVYWQADDIATVLWYEQRYFAGGNAYIEDHVRNDDGLTWTTYKYVQKIVSQDDILEQVTSHGSPADVQWMELWWEAGSWQLEGTFKHSYWIPPIVEWAHLPHPNDFYGQMEFNEKDLIDTINRLWSEISRIVHIHSDPKDVITGSSPDEVEQDGGVLSVDSPQARVTRLTLNQGALSETLETVQKLVETYLAISRVVLLKGEAKDLQRVTNASVRTLFLDAISKNYLLQSGYGQGVSRIGELGMKMSNLPQRVNNLPIICKFPEPLPIDMTELANSAAILHQLGAWSLRTIRVKTGVDPTFEANNLEEEADVAFAEAERMAELNKPEEPAATPETSA